MRGGGEELKELSVRNKDRATGCGRTRWVAINAAVGCRRRPAGTEATGEPNICKNTP